MPRPAAGPDRSRRQGPARRPRRGVVRRRWIAAAGALLAAVLSSCVDDTAAFYAQTTALYRMSGALRADYDPADAPFDNADLLRDFQRIAFSMEYAPGEAVDRTSTPIELFKWSGPVTWSLEGDGVGPEDPGAWEGYAARLSRLTGLDFARRPPGPEAAIRVMILGPEDRAAMAERAAADPDWRERPLLRRWTSDDRLPCVSQVERRIEDGVETYSAIIAVKAETRGVLREGCMHEELAQMLGLVNDDDDARPSIFNDDQEFSLLTRHDEYLLRILYDPRLSSGMTAAEGMPIVRRIVNEIGPGPLLPATGGGA